MRSQNSQTFKGLTWIINFSLTRLSKQQITFLKLSNSDHRNNGGASFWNISPYQPTVSTYISAHCVTFSSLQYDCKHLTLVSNCIWKACLQHKATLFTNKPLPALNNIPSLSFHFQQQEAWTATLSWDFGPGDRFILINLLWAWPTFFVFNSRVPPILATLGGNASKQRKQWNPAGVVIMPGI